MQEIFNYLPKNLGYLRRKKGLRQQEMQLPLGFTRSTWSNYENGKTNPSVNDLILISKFFGITLDELIGHDLEANAPATDNSVMKRTRGKRKLYPVNNAATYAHDASPEYTLLWQEFRKLRADVDTLKRMVNKK